VSKLIHSPVDKFPGDVTLYDPVPYPAYIAWEKSVKFGGEAQDSEKQLALFDGAKAMCEKWDIPNFDIDNPPATPRTAVLNLLAWLVTEIGKVIAGESDPN
jgi:hypothetical protein